MREHDDPVPRGVLAREPSRTTATTYDAIAAAIRRLEPASRARALSRRTTALRRIRDAVDVLSEASTPGAMIRAAAPALCDACGFERVMISDVRGSRWAPHVMYARTSEGHIANAAFDRLVTGSEIPLRGQTLELGLFRRREPALIADPRADERIFRPLVTVARSDGFVAAPLVTSTGVIGFVHADAFGSGRELTANDRENVRAFADALSLEFERLVLSLRLRTQHELAREAFRHASAAGGTPGVGRFRAPDRLHRTTAGPAPVAVATPGSPLSAREVEVLTWIATGATNGEIAERLVIAEGTVKSHVKRIMRKLGTTTRSAAVSRYYLLSAAGRVGGRDAS
ncbi:helix-turn-helix transcriptional regulator [Patulibacter sp. NPDC049589]|uniref:helix-turn-helix transcriptional regulator n=1 Tax=Patulibacter sp. NPDC049589 TaxID=3154731 RepID=UPI003425EF8E